MAIGPKDLALTQKELDEVARLESKIDEQIKQKFEDTGKMIEVSTGLLDRRIMNELIRRYKEAGWKTVDPNMRDTGLQLRGI